MRLTLRTACRIALAAWMTVVGCTTLATAPRTIAAASSTWYWQNPLPRAYAIGGIACHSVTACVAVGAGGLIVTTDNGGKRWTARTSGTTHDLVSVTCPGRAICYALSGAITGPSPTGRLEGVNSVVLRSVDGGKSWGQRAVSLSDGSNEQLASLVCPTTTICLASGWLRQWPATAGATGAVLRTTDGGKTWQAWSIPGLQRFADIVCPKVTLCYAAAWTNGQSHVVLSSDGGKTWTQQGLRTPRGLTGISCPEAQTCFAITVDCGGECDTGHIYRTTDSARSWKRLSSVRAGGIACPRATTCYESDGTSRWLVRLRE